MTKDVKDFENRLGYKTGLQKQKKDRDTAKKRSRAFAGRGSQN